MFYWKFSSRGHKFTAINTVLSLSPSELQQLRWKPSKVNVTNYFLLKVDNDSLLKFYSTTETIKAKSNVCYSSQLNPLVHYLALPLVYHLHQWFPNGMARHMSVPGGKSICTLGCYYCIKAICAMNYYFNLLYHFSKCSLSLK